MTKTGWDEKRIGLRRRGKARDVSHQLTSYSKTHRKNTFFYQQGTFSVDFSHGHVCVGGVGRCLIFLYRKIEPENN